MGSFRLVAGNRHLHRHYKFAVPVGKTVALSLRHSCRSELTRQGISLNVVTSSPPSMVLGRARPKSYRWTYPRFTGKLLRLLDDWKAGWTFLPPSPCRHGVRTVSFPICIGIWRTVSEDFSGLLALKGHRFSDATKGTNHRGFSPESVVSHFRLLR